MNCSAMAVRTTALAMPHRIVVLRTSGAPPEHHLSVTDGPSGSRLGSEFAGKFPGSHGRSQPDVP